MKKKIKHFYKDNYLLIVYCSLLIKLKNLWIQIKFFPYHKYLSVASTSWQNGFVYRLNFIMWRVRMFISLLTFYYLWLVVSGPKDLVFTYTQPALISYVIIEWLIWNLVVSSRSIDAQGEIATGDLNNYLIKPVNYFFYWFSRDLADKLLNVLFSVFELILFFLIIKPPFEFASNPFIVLAFMLSVWLAVFVYFFFSFVVSMTTFWYYENNGWSQRFLIFTLITTLGGGMFPLDILPKYFYNLLKFLPTAYFAYFPTQIYLNRLTPFSILSGLFIQIFWLIAFVYLANYLWKKGLKVYGAYGR